MWNQIKACFMLWIIPQVKSIPIYYDDNNRILNYRDSAIETQEEDDGILILLFILLSFFAITFVFSVLSLIVFSIRRRFAVSEEDLVRQEENQVYLELDSDEQELYFQSRDYLSLNPYYQGELTLSQKLSIQEKGITAWEFVKDPMLTNIDLLILNKYELNFFKKFECSAQTNLPIPTKNEVYYFESKIYNLPDPENTIISLGLGVKPYPWFRLPGRHIHSVSYDSDGYRRHKQPLKLNYEPPFSKFFEGDVIGIGYRVRTGTIFFTRNGKKVSESKIGGHIKNFKIPNNGQLYPIIGANNLCSIHVNIGQRGFVFIEGNVKKWGFAPLEGSGPAPPAYNKFNSDILLERSEIDESELSERENDFPPDFWQVSNGDETSDKFSYNAYADETCDERITLNSLLPPNNPPSYNKPAELGDEHEDEHGHEHGDQHGDEVQESDELDSDIDADESYFSEQFATAIVDEDSNDNNDDLTDTNNVAEN